MCNEKKEVKNGVATEGRGLGSSEQVESRAGNAGVNATNVSSGMTQFQNGVQIIHQQPQGSSIRWDTFLPVGTLKVLLVENDDSTRHVVSALLRNCSYEVTAVANGVQAWRILEEGTNHVDLVLTEVAMPIFSGIGLLCKIMSHRTFKHIPVIMMSSHDSMGVVFKCLSKGAVDFLVKPIRKNELKNLWQHVWRRCHSSSDSGSESGTQSKKSAKTKSYEYDESANHSSSGNEHENISNGLMIQDGSDNGSGTQSSWTKKAADANSPQPVSPLHQSADTLDSTRAQVIQTRTGTFSDMWMHVTETNDCHEQDEQLGKDLQVGITKNMKSQCENQLKSLFNNQTSQKLTKLPEEDDKLSDSLHLEHSKENLSAVPVKQPLNVMNQIAKSAIVEVKRKEFHTRKCPLGISQVKQKAASDPGEMPSHVLTVTGKKGTGECGDAASVDHNVLRHSDSSAFSKYNTASSANKVLNGNIGSSSPLDDMSVALKMERTSYFPSHSSSTPLNQRSNESSHNNDAASATKCVTHKPEALSDKPEPQSAFKPFQLSTFQPLQSSHVSSFKQVLPEKEDDAGVNTFQARLKRSNKQVQPQNPHNYHHHHHHHHHHHYHHHDQNMEVMEQNQHELNHDNMLKKTAVDAPQCGSSNMFDGPTEGLLVNCSVNGSATSSNHGQSQNASALDAEQKNMGSDNGAGENSGVGLSSRKIIGSGADDDRAALREAALIKFRQKRKERCFEKRVRYHSRKKLAEQRPRVRGQFVRQYDSKSGNDCPGSCLVSEDDSPDSLR